MGLFDWLRGLSAKQAQRLPGPTPEGLYGLLPKGAVWQLGPDPAGDPMLFVPQRGDLPLDIVEYERSDEFLKAIALVRWKERPIGFGLFLPVSDGTRMDGVQTISMAAGGRPVPQGRLEWIIPKGHPTREVALTSLGEPTTNLVRLLEECFGTPTTTRSAIAANNSIICEMVILRGMIEPEKDRMTARCKIFLRTSAAEDETYAEFFLSINTLAKKIWVSEKAAQYRAPIVGWATGEIRRLH
jgi:hypothetical protein